LKLTATPAGQRMRWMSGAIGLPYLIAGMKIPRAARAAWSPMGCAGAAAARPAGRAFPEASSGPKMSEDVRRAHSRGVLTGVWIYLGQRAVAWRWATGIHKGRGGGGVGGGGGGGGGGGR